MSVVAAARSTPIVTTACIAMALKSATPVAARPGHLPVARESRATRMIISARYWSVTTMAYATMVKIVVIAPTIAYPAAFREVVFAETVFVRLATVRTPAIVPPIAMAR
jgi:hypothetical protein